MLLLCLTGIFSSPVTMTIDGQTTTKYVIHNGGTISSSGDEITVPYNTRGYIGDIDSLGSKNFYQSKMLGSSISFDIDYSEVECSCNGALYLI